MDGSIGVETQVSVGSTFWIELDLAKRPSSTVAHAAAASDGGAGLDLVRANAPRLVLLDLDLPDISGSEVLARLRADPRTSRVPVIIVSAGASPGRARELEDAGANGYLTKPLDVRRLLAIVDAVAPLGDAA